MAIDVNADFTPSIPDSGINTSKLPYNPTGSFKFWAQKVLPAVYDDSLSYYEILCKVVDYLNNVIQNVDDLNTSVDNTNTSFAELQGYVNSTKSALITAYNQLQEYVNTYFDNLDVQEEINEKLDEMADSGALSQLIDPLIPDLVTTWLNAHVNPVGSAVVVDNTLTVSGAAADAKVVGDEITTFKNEFKQNVFVYSSDRDSQIARIVVPYGDTIEISWENASNLTYIDIYEFGPNSENSRVFRIIPTTAGSYTYTPTYADVNYTRIYGVVSGAGATVTMTISGRYYVDLKQIENKLTDTVAPTLTIPYRRLGNGELTKFYPVYSYYYKIVYRNPVKISTLDFYEFYLDGTNKRVARIDDPASSGMLLYTPTRTDVNYLRVYTIATDSDSTSAIELIIHTLSAYRTSDFATDFSLSKEFSAVKKFTVIGDSMASGYYKESATGAQHPRNLLYSWPQIMARTYGQVAQNASKSGATCATWWEDSDGTCKAMVTPDRRSQIYVMALGTNDYKDITDDDITPEQIGSSADIDAEDYNQNADSFWGNYCKILQYVHETAPDAKIICCTIPQPRPDTEWKQEAIREITAYSLFSGYVTLCDLNKWYNDLSDSRAMQSEMWQGHFTSVGYANSSEFLMYALSKTIQANLSMFINLPLIPYDVPVTPDYIDALFSVSGDNVIDIISRNVDNIVVSGKYLQKGTKVYFKATLLYTNTVVTGRNDIFTNLPSPLYTYVKFPEYKNNEEMDTFLSYTTAWRVNGAHSIGDVYTVYGEYDVA